MKSTVKIIIALLCSALFLASCNKDTYGTYTYNCIYVSTSGVADSLSRVQIIDHCRSVEYFTKEHSYEGTYTDCFKLAIDEFSAAVLKLDDQYIEDRLAPGENFAIYCIDSSSGGYIAYKTWYNPLDE